MLLDESAPGERLSEYLGVPCASLGLGKESLGLMNKKASKQKKTDTNFATRATCRIGKRILQQHPSLPETFHPRDLAVPHECQGVLRIVCAT